MNNSLDVGATNIMFKVIFYLLCFVVKCTSKKYFLTDNNELVRKQIIFFSTNVMGYFIVKLFLG